ncbi:MAG TPA: hypothetical protein VL463_01935 [Kofleriaceae bacterium]|nr:hypothetical protein [Kofleriaceae bacterium]
MLALLAVAALGKHHVTITPCTIEGPELVLAGELVDGLAVAPDGALIVIDGHADLHRYTIINKGADCTLKPDGVIETGLPTPFEIARVRVDPKSGAIYAHVGVIATSSNDVRIDGKKIEEACAARDEKAPMCARDAWPVGDRRIVEGDPLMELRDHDGKLVHPLFGARPATILARSWAACGAGICAAGEYAFYAWDARGTLVGSFSTDSLSYATGQWDPAGFVMIGKTGYLLGDEYTDGAPRKAAMIQRVDGLP